VRAPLSVSKPATAAQPRRYLALQLPWLSAQRMIRDGCAPPDAPFVAITKERGAFHIMALSPGAAQLGLPPGMALADALAMVPDLIALAHDPAADAALLGRLADFCQRYTPSVEALPPQAVVLDITGCAHLFSAGEAGLIADLQHRLQHEGLTAQIAGATTPDAARVLARFGGSDVRDAPVTALAVTADIHTALRRAGLRSIGAVADVPRAALAARFGSQLPVLLERLLGHEGPRIVPRKQPVPIEAALNFAEPIGRSADVLEAIEQLLDEAAGQLVRRGAGGRVFVVRLHRSDGHIAELMVETGAPTRDAALVLRLVRERIDALADPLDPGFGYDSLSLAVPHSEPLAPAQASLDQHQNRANPGDLLDRLAVRYGPERVLRLDLQDRHLPERAARLRPVNSPAPAAPHPRDLPPRPLTLFDPPQRVEVLAAVPDGPPHRFRWRGKAYRVVRQEGPERIAPEWWQSPRGHAEAPGLTRDYYSIEDEAGHRFWLFRHGLYGSETNDPAWYVHGLFA
jgi:protein ImuB